MCIRWVQNTQASGFRHCIQCPNEVLCLRGAGLHDKGRSSVNISVHTFANQEGVEGGGGGNVSMVMELGNVKVQ